MTKHHAPQDFIRFIITFQGGLNDMISFKNDYSEGAHPRILEALGRINLDRKSVV